MSRRTVILGGGVGALATAGATALLFGGTFRNSGAIESEVGSRSQSTSTNIERKAEDAGHRTRSRVDQLSAELIRLTGERQSLHKPAGVDLAIRRSTVRARIEELRTRRDAAALELAELKATPARSAKELADWDKVTRERQKAACEDDQILQAAIRERVTCAKEYSAEIGAGKTDVHRDVIIARNRMDAAEAAVNARTAVIAERVALAVEQEKQAAERRGAAAIAAGTEVVQARIGEFDRLLTAATDELAQIESDRATATALRMKAEELDEKIAAVQSQLISARSESDEHQAATRTEPASASNVASAARPGSTSDRSIVPLAVGMSVLGAGVGAGIGLLMGRRRSSDTPHEPRATRQWPIMGEVPSVDCTGEDKRLADALRAIRTRIMAGACGPAIYLTGETSGAGVSSIVLGLAAALGAAGRAVLMVDTNCFKPDLHRRAGLSGSLRGLFDVLTGDAELSEIVYPTPVASVSVMPAGNIPAAPADVLASPAVAALIDGVAGRYDYVLVDCPSLDHPETMPFLMAGQDVLCIVNYRHQHSGAGTTRLDALSTRLKGLIVNRTNGASGRSLVRRDSKGPKQLA